MKTYCFKLVATIVLSALVVACGKEEPWVNNPKKIAFAKSGESLTDLSKRLMGQPVTSLGLSLGSDSSFYQSGALWIAGIFGKDGQPIFDVSQTCKGDKLIPLGELFGDLDCKKETLARLSSMAKDPSSGIKEACTSKEYDPSQTTAGYLNPQKGIYWMTGNAVDKVGVYKEFVATYEGGFAPCDLNARAEFQKAEEKRLADEKKWFVEDGFGGISLNKCREDEGPSKMIDLSQKLREEYGTTDEIKEGNTIVQTTLNLYARGASITYYRGRTRCENALAQRAKTQTDAVNKYK
jgi:hypothetical protein